MNIQGISTLFFVIVLYVQNIEASNLKPLLWNIDRLRLIKQNQKHIHGVQNLILEAEKIAAQKQYISVTQKERSLSNDIHNYESLSSYYWPNTQNPNGPYIEKDGMLNPETKKDDRARLNKVSNRIMKLSLAYYLTDDIKYFNECIQQINIWFLNVDSYMYPHFKYAKKKKNSGGNKGKAHGIIDAYIMNDIIESVRLLDYIKKCDEKFIKSLQKWFEDFAIWLTTDELGIIESKQKNNHAIAYDTLLLNISLFTENYQRADSIVSNFRKKRLQVLFKKDDGSQPGEQHRTRSYYYSYYNLIHVVDWCKILQSIGINYYVNNRDIIDKAFKYVESYIDNRQSYPFQEIGNWNRICEGIKVECERLNQLATKEYSVKAFDDYYPDFYKNIYLWIK